MQGSPLKSFLSRQEPQASEEDVSVGTDALGRCHEAEHRSFEDVGSSRDMHTELQEKDCVQLGSS